MKEPTLLETPKSLENYQTSPKKLALLSIDDHIIFANSAFREGLEPPGQQIERLKVLDILNSEDQATYLNKKQSLMEQAAQASTVFQVTSGSSSLPQNFLLCLIRDPKGLPLYFRVLISSQEPRELQTGTVEFPVIINRVNQEGIFTHTQGSTQEVLPEILGKHFREIYRDRPETRTRIERALSGETFNEEIYYDGFWYQVFYQPLKDDNGNLQGAQWQSQLINKQKFTEAKLKSDLSASQTAVQLREDLLYIASHDIRSPLATLAMQIEILENCLSRGNIEKAQAIARRLSTSGKKQISHISDLIRRTLDVARMHTHGLTLEYDLCDFTDILNDVLERCSNQAQEAQCELRVTAPSELKAYWDHARIQQMLENLLSNAIKYGRGKPVSLEALIDGDNVRIFVRDFGEGISPTDQAHLFERFSRGPGHAHIEGFGMGLYIVKKVVDAHQGSVHVESHLGQGTSFEVVLPLRAPHLRAHDQ